MITNNLIMIMLIMPAVTLIKMLSRQVCPVLCKAADHQEWGWTEDPKTECGVRMGVE